MQRNRYMVSIVFLTFFVMSLLTNILGPIVPDIIGSFKVSLTAAALLPFSFFIAYGVMSIPAGFLVERFGEKPVMIAAFLAGMLGSLSFAFHPTYQVAIVSFFVMGSGMATLQTPINPLLRVAGGEQNYAFNSALAQLIFGVASFISPYLYSYLVLNLGTAKAEGNPLLTLLGKLTPPALPWASIYWIFALFTLIMIAVLLLSTFPRVERTAEESTGTWSMYGSLFRKPMVWAFFIAMFAYVGCEQGTADWISKFLSTYHGFDPHTTGAMAVSWFWGLLTAGCFIGMGLLKLFDSRYVLDRHVYSGASLPDPCSLRTGERFSRRLSRSRTLCFGHVADHHFALAELGFRTSWGARRHHERRHHGRSRDPIHHRTHCRFVRIARGSFVSLHHLRLCVERGLLGEAHHQQCNHQQ